jgi:hypothetical protein
MLKVGFFFSRESSERLIFKKKKKGLDMKNLIAYKGMMHARSAWGRKKTSIFEN